MAIALSSNLKYNGPFSNFTRDSFKTLSEMKSFEEKFLDPGHISFCEEDRNTYKYDPNNPIDTTTGKWR